MAINEIIESLEILRKCGGGAGFEPTYSNEGRLQSALISSQNYPDF